MYTLIVLMTVQIRRVTLWFLPLNLIKVERLWTLAKFQNSQAEGVPGRVTCNPLFKLMVFIDFCHVAAADYG